MMIASAPSTPAAHSRARWPEENVRRGGGVRWPPVVRRAAGARPVGLTAARACAPDGMAAGVALGYAVPGLRRAFEDVGERYVNVPVAQADRGGLGSGAADIDRGVRFREAKPVEEVHHPTSSTPRRL